MCVSAWAFLLESRFYGLYLALPGRSDGLTGFTSKDSGSRKSRREKIGLLMFVGICPFPRLAIRMTITV
jgi:hypothetical protein